MTGCSTLMTSAPSSARTIVQYGPDRKRVRSRTRKPSSGRPCFLPVMRDALTVLRELWHTPHARHVPRASRTLSEWTKSGPEQPPARNAVQSIDRAVADPALLRRPSARPSASPTSRRATGPLHQHHTPAAGGDGAQQPGSLRPALTAATGSARCSCSSCAVRRAADDACATRPYPYMVVAARRGRRDRGPARAAADRRARRWSTRSSPARSSRRSYTEIGDARSPLPHGAPGKAILSTLPVVACRTSCPVPRRIEAVTEPYDHRPDDLLRAELADTPGSAAGRTPDVRAHARASARSPPPSSATAGP